MSISPHSLKLLWGKAGAHCSFPDCRRELVADATDLDGEVILGEIAHIVAQSKSGPRGENSPPGGDIDGYGNLLLVCEEHHRLIDGQPHTYTVPKLVQMKEDHERWVNERLSELERFQRVRKPSTAVEETVYSTLVAVIKMPQYVYSAPCHLTEREVRNDITYPVQQEVLLPYIVRGGELITFSELGETHGPFHRVIDRRETRQYYAPTWWEDRDKARWYVELLNRALNKLTGRKGLNLDRDHSRYYFEPDEGDRPRAVYYRSLTGRMISRHVAWQPKFRHSGESKSYWEHLAVGLSFHRVSNMGWCLSIRPERRFTRDGNIPLTSKGTGRRSTSRQSKMYNIDVLKEVDFWRDFLSDGGPRIILKFGLQSLIIDTAPMSSKLTWPGVPEDAGSFTYVRYEDDLFTYAEFQEALMAEEGNDEMIDSSTWEEDDHSEH